MSRKYLWYYRIGMALLLLGIIIVIVSVVFLRSHWGYAGENLFYWGVAASIVICVGFVFIAKGIYERYFKPLKYFILPHLPPGPYNNPNIRSLPPFRPCGQCRRQIPFDSSLCPYCGLNQGPRVGYGVKVKKSKMV